MTERHEVTSMVELVRNASDDIFYEATSIPGESDEFKSLLWEAMKLLDSALDKLAKAESMLPEYDHEPKGEAE